MAVQDSLSMLVWGNAGVLSKIVTQSVSVVVLSRLLLPIEFGKLSVALIPIGIGIIVSEAGLGNALIASGAKEGSDWSRAHVTQVVVGLCLCVLGFAVAPSICVAMKAPESEPMMQVALLTIVLSAAAQVPESLLRKQFRFKRIAFIKAVVATTSMFLVTLPLAFWTRSAWSLVLGMLFSSLLSLYLFRRASSLLCLSWDVWKMPATVWSEGGLIMLASLCAWGSTNIESILLGILAGPESLGVYVRLQALAFNPLMMFFVPSVGVLVSVFAKARHSGGNVLRGWMFYSVVFLFATGLFCSAFVFLGQSLPVAFLGKAYGPFHTVLATVCASGALLLSRAPQLALFQSLQCARWDLWIVFFIVPVKALLVLWLYDGSLGSFAVAVAIASGLAFVVGALCCIVCGLNHHD